MLAGLPHLAWYVPQGHIEVEVQSHLHVVVEDDPVEHSRQGTHRTLSSQRAVAPRSRVRGQTPLQL